MQCQGSVSLVTVKKNRHAHDGRMSHPERSCDVAPKGQLDETVVRHYVAKQDLCQDRGPAPFRAARVNALRTVRAGPRLEHFPQPVQDNRLGHVHVEACGPSGVAILISSVTRDCNEM